MLDIALRCTVGDARRRFDLDLAWCTDAPVAALYGPSGAGKSLTMQAIAGLLRPQAGHVRVGGRTLFDAAAGIDLPPEQRELGYLFQDYALFPHLDVRRNIGFGLGRWWRRPSAEARRRVDALIERFGLQGLADARPQDLSGGQRQRVALARALACEPRLLLLDEPFAALNPMLRRQLRDELAATIRDSGVPAVLITHDLDDVLALANVACLVDGGRIVREVDLDRATAREPAVRSLDAAAAAPVREGEARLRALLSGGGHG